MALDIPLWMENGSYTGTSDRELINLLFSTAGIVSFGDLLVAQRAAGANMSVDVAAGTCIIIGTDIVGQGKYACKSDAVTNVTIAAAPGSGQSRIDLIVAQVRDADADAGSNNDWIITAVTGAAASTGSQHAPGIPASALVLAEIAVGPSVTSIVNANVTDERTVASLQSGATGALASYHSTAATSTAFGTSHFSILDSTLIVPTFVLPTSGKALVEISGGIGTSAAAQVYLALFAHSTTTKYGPSVQVLQPGAALGEWSFNVRFLITGTPGATIPALDLYGYTSAGTVTLETGDPAGSTSVAPTALGVPFDVLVTAA